MHNKHLVIKLVKLCICEFALFIGNNVQTINEILLSCCGMYVKIVSSCIVELAVPLRLKFIHRGRFPFSVRVKLYFETDSY